MTTARYSLIGAQIGWNAADFSPTEATGWDTYSARADRYQLYMNYTNNTAYETAINTYATVMLHQKKLYKHTRGVKTPAARLVDFDVSKVYPGSLDMESAENGAVPIQGDARIRQGIIHLWDTSNFSSLKNIYVRNGSMLGDSFIKLVNDPVEGCIYMEVIPPSHVVDFKTDKQGLITYAVIEYMMYENSSAAVNNSSYRASWTYKEVIELVEEDGELKTLLSNFKNNQPYAYYKDARGNPVQTWEEGYGFIPIVQAQHTNLGFASGANCFQTIVGKIDEINAQASLLNDQVNKAVNVVWLFAGVGKGNGADGSDAPMATLNNDEKTNVPILSVGQDATATPLIANINIADALANIESLEASIEREKPQLALYRLWEAQQISGVAVAKVYDPVVSYIKSLRGNFDSALVNAQQMGLAMGGYHGYPEYRGFAVTDYMSGNLKHTIRDRMVFDDSIDKPAKILALQSVKDQPSEIAALMLNELDYSEDVIAKVVSQLNDQQASADEAAARAFMMSALGSGDNGDDTQDTQQRTQLGSGTTAARTQQFTR